MVINARALLAAVLLVLVPLAARATAEAPVLGRLVDSGQLGRPTRHAHARLKPFLHRGGVGSLARAKEGAALFAPTPSARSRARVSSTVVAGFDGIDEVSTLAQPPDGAIAVSSSYIVEAVNSAVSVWTKTYDATGQLSAVTRAIDAASLDVLFGNNPGCYTGANDFFGLVSDPSADYDVAHDRFMLSVISFDQLFFTSSVCIAVTETGNPTGNWFIYAFPVSPFTSLLDFPRAVVGADGQIYLAGNLFLCCDALGEPIFDHARVYAFTATDMYVGGNATARFVVVGNDPESGTPADSLTPARAVGVAGMYFVSASSPVSSHTGSVVTLWRWADPFGANVFARQGWVTVSTYTQPPNALQPNALPPGVTDCTQPGAICVTTNDARNLTAHWSGNTVWAAHNIGCTQAGTPVACVQWYRLGSLDGAPALLQQGIVDDGRPGQYRYFPSVAADGNGNVVLAYAHSSALDYAGIRYTPIVSGTPGLEVMLKAGEATLEESRYGDYAATALDPHDNLTIWHVEEYAKDFLDGVTGWGTWISAVQITGTPTPPGDFSMAATPTFPAPVLPGGSQSYAVTVGALNGFTGTVSLSVGGLPSGASGSFSPSEVAAPGTSTLDVATSATTVGGNYTVTIRGTANGLTHTTTVTLAVQDYSITVSPSSRTVSRGGSTSYAVTVNAINGYSRAVTFTSPTGLPRGVTFGPLPTSAPPGASFALTLSASRNARKGTYTLTLSATDAGITRSASYQLRVR